MPLDPHWTACNNWRMDAFLRVLSRSAGFALLPLLALPSPANAGVVRKGLLSGTRLSQITPNEAIIPLPLNPIIPASQRMCSARTSSGLGYTVLRQGTGAKPTASSGVTVNYIGYLSATGVVFDQSMETAMSLDGVIPGFSEGMRLVAPNGVVRICVPAALGYGAKATGPIPANSDLVFQVELLSIRSDIDAN